MNFRRLAVLPALLIFTLSNPTLSQRPRYEAPFRRPCDFGEPLTRLEEFDARMQTVIIRGSTHVMTLTARNGSARVDAIELRDDSNGASTSGVVVELKDTTRQDATRPADESRSYIDYEEIERVIKAWDRVARTDDTITKLNNFESRYRTRGTWRLPSFAKRREDRSLRPYRAAFATE